MKLFFNSSMPRSGSELLQVLLHQNPDIYASPTSPLLEYQFGARSNYELSEVRSQPPEMMRKAFMSMCKGMSESYYESITDRPNVIDKNRGWLYYYNWVDKWYPQPKMVCMVRDIRDTLCSMERVFQDNRHRPIGPDNPAEMQNITFQQRCNYWLNSQPIGLALQRLYEATENQLPILYIRYEDLVENPQNELNRWYDFTELEIFQHNFENVEKLVQEDSSVFGPYGDHTIKPVVKPPEKTWRDILTVTLSEGIVNNNKWFYELFYPNII